VNSVKFVNNFAPTTVQFSSESKAFTGVKKLLLTQSWSPKLCLCKVTFYAVLNLLFMQLRSSSLYNHEVPNYAVFSIF